jgi:hypothetical protein
VNRHIKPIKLWFGNTRWHKEEQWLLEALDLEKIIERVFALKDIQN